MKKITKKSGFTLVEIMIVVAIIGLLAAIGLPSFTKARANSITKSQQNNARILSSAVEEWAMETSTLDDENVDITAIDDYIKGGVASLGVTNLPSTSVGYYSTNLAVIAEDMY